MMNNKKDFLVLSADFPVNGTQTLVEEGLLAEQTQSWDLSRAFQISPPLTSTFWMQHYPRHLQLKTMLAARVFLGKPQQPCPWQRLAGSIRNEKQFCATDRDRDKPHPSSAASNFNC